MAYMTLMVLLLSYTNPNETFQSRFIITNRITLNQHITIYLNLSTIQTITPSNSMRMFMSSLSLVFIILITCQPKLHVDLSFSKHRWHHSFNTISSWSLSSDIQNLILVQISVKKRQHLGWNSFTTCFTSLLWLNLHTAMSSKIGYPLEHMHNGSWSLGGPGQQVHCK